MNCPVCGNPVYYKFADQDRRVSIIDIRAVCPGCLTEFMW